MTKIHSLLLALGLVASASAEVIVIDANQPRTTGTLSQQIEHEAKRFNRTFANLSKPHRKRSQVQISMPVTVVVRGKETPYAGGTFSLQFDATGSRSFPAEYRDLLQSVCDSASSTMAAVFGQPFNPTTVNVKNYDADIQDRYAVSGGIYVVSGGTREIRFPVYASPEAAAVNFVHCLLLAFQGDRQWPTDALQEGLVRAAVMRVVRTPGAMPNTLDSGLLEDVLQSTYDIGATYDWVNQPGLSAVKFIAPNLRDPELPAGGSVGGPYLLRYQMSGSAWQKALAENAGFIAELNRRFYLNPAIASGAAFLTAGQASIDTVTGTSGALIEGQTFAEWYRRQFVLQSRDTLGPKLIVQPVPLPPEASTTDFGVFDVVAHYFETQTGGNEVLSSGTCYPIFWDNNFNRLFPSAQEDRMDIAGAYGSVTPNFPDLNGGVPYRTTIDLPVGDRIARTYVPAGGVASAANLDGNSFYGTVIGLSLGTGETARIRVTVGSNVFDNCPVRDGAFGAQITSNAFLGYARVRVEVVKRVGSTDVVAFTRLVNKGPGALGLDIRVGGDLNFAPSGGLTKGVSLLGFPVETYSTDLAEALGVNPNTLLAARYNTARARYDLYPDAGPVRTGNAFYLRLNANNVGFFTPGRYHPGTPTAVALRPGWNLIASPLPANVTLSRIRVVRGADFPKFYVDAVGIEIGTDVFGFVPGPNDTVTGAPETGTMAPVTTFEPGKGYYVRCLAPEGVTLLFEPATPSTRESRTSTTAHLDGWEVVGTLKGVGGMAKIVIGATTGATRGFNARFDSAVPPRLVGGLQMVSSGNLFRDVRDRFTKETWTLKLQGLKPGKSYMLSFGRTRGPIEALSVYDPMIRRTTKVLVPSLYRFTASSSTRTLTVTPARRHK